MAQKETLGARVTRLEELVKILFDAQIKTEETIQRTRQESAEREKRVDERIEKLVIAIGELISHMPPIPPVAS
jgi:predicted  nucleic acid-binding Zn-ribbon protein